MTEKKRKVASLLLIPTKGTAPKPPEDRSRSIFLDPCHFPYYSPSVFSKFYVLFHRQALDLVRQTEEREENHWWE